MRLEKRNNKIRFSYKNPIKIDFKTKIKSSRKIKNPLSSEMFKYLYQDIPKNFSMRAKSKSADFEQSNFGTVDILIR